MAILHDADKLVAKKRNGGVGIAWRNGPGDHDIVSLAFEFLNQVEGVAYLYLTGTSAACVG